METSTWDPRAVPVTFIKDAAQARSELEGTLCKAERVSVDTETVILRDADGNIIKRDLDVDGPGPWRVMSIAAKFITSFGVEYRAWVLDMKDINASVLIEAFRGVTPWGWNANFDRGVLTRGGLPVRRWYDAMLFDAVLKQGAYYAAGERAWYTSLADAVVRWLGLKGIEGKEDVRLNYDETTELTEAEIRYAGDDAITTLFVSEVLEAEAEKHGLVEAGYRASAAAPFIHSMKVNGLPFDVTTYQAVIDNATAKANAAAERIAVLTTGQAILRTLVRWAANAGVLEGDPVEIAAKAEDVEYVINIGLPLLHNPDVFGQFLTAIREQRAGLEAKVAAALGIDEPTEDLFSDDVRYQLPFELGDGTKIRRWINKVAPQFVAEFLAAAGSTTRGLTTANDMSAVYREMSQMPADVTAEIAQVATYLDAYARYTASLDQYGDIAGSTTLRPDWNLGSNDQVKDVLNTYAQENVLAYTKALEKSARLLGKADSVDNKALKLIGGPLCAAMLEFREHDKVVTTYGDELLKFVHPQTGRVHASYTQELTGTARLASFAPNAQNLSPLAKPHMCVVRRGPDGKLVTRDPDERMRVLICADLSQAELRFLADMAQDENMLAAFRSGEDLHERTASLMFSIDLKSLKVYGDLPIGQVGQDVAGLAPYIVANPDMPAKDLYKQLRSKAKAVSFGYAYGLKGASLAQQLTVQGVPTTKEEADELLAKFDIAYPQVAAWMAGRVKFIQDLSNAIKDETQPSGVDFEASWRLHKLFYRANQTRKALTTKLGHKPTSRQIAEALIPDEELRTRLGVENLTEEQAAEDPNRVIEDAKRFVDTRNMQAEQVAWALGHYGSAILAEDGTPWSFESRNVTGRRRLFQIGTSDWVLAMVSLVARSRRAYAKGITDAWVTAYNAEQDQAVADRVAAGQRGGVAKHIALTKQDPRTKREVSLTNKELEKALPTKELRISFVNFVLQQYESLPNPAAARDYLFRHAMAECIRAAGNQYRNHPIQSGVADAVLEAYARIDAELTERFPTAKGIQSVHDSIVVECDLADAKAVRELVVRHMEASLAELCPTVPCKADGDVQLSLDDHTIVKDEELDELLATYALAA